MNALTSGCNSLEVIQFLFPLSHRVSNVKCIIRFELSSLSIHVLRSHARSVCHRSMRAQYAWCQVLECSTLQLTALLRLTSSNPPALTGAEHTLICISSVISPPSSQPYTVHYCTYVAPMLSLMVITITIKLDWFRRTRPILHFQNLTFSPTLY